MPNLYKKISIYLLFLFINFTLTSCAGFYSAPNYSEEKNWSALPTKKDVADETLPNLENQQSIAKADVFYVHPTTYDGLIFLNADVDDSKLNELTDVEAVKIQTSIFNGSAKIYAPRYRQASMFAFDPINQDALDIAYTDVREAFLFYLKNYNQNRPIVIVSHSQGSYHAVRLLREFNLEKKLVVAYLIGEKIGENNFSNLKPCKNATQTNCFVTFASVLEGYKTQLVTGEPIGKRVCINPLSFEMNEEKVSAQKNLGGVPESFNRIDKNITSAKCDNGNLYIEKPTKQGYPDYNRDYHLSDFNLFYMNLRQNIEERIKSFGQRKN